MGKAKWWAFTDENHGGIHDPRKHDKEVLEEFFLAHPYEGSGGSDKWSLVEQIKKLQRSGEEAKQKWWAFTDEHHGGIHDPKKHDKAVLEEFFVAHPYEGGSDKWALVEKIKTLQRSGDEAKQKWWAFTDAHHGGVHDPKKHDKAVLEEFLATCA